MTTALTRQEQSDLRACEQVISKGINTFREVGKALAKIRDAKLYKAEYKSFEKYCDTRWGFNRVYAHRLIEAADVPEVLPTGQQIDTERKARKYLDEQKAEAKAEPKPRTVVAEFAFDDEPTADPGEDDARVSSGHLPEQSDLAGAGSNVPPDRITWVRDHQERLYNQFVHTFGEDAAWSCWLAGQEAFNIQHETE